MRSMTIVVFCSILLIVTSGLSRQAAGAASRDTADKIVAIDNFTFNAAALTVGVGTQVTWVNHDDVPHKIVSTEKKFASPVLDTDGRFSYTFTAPGTYEYFCSLHPMMKGKVIVR